MGSGAGRAARAWARADLRGRWRSVVALGIIIGVTGGLALAALTGSVRSGTALERLEHRTNGADAIVFSSQVAVYHPGWTKLAARPEVKRVAPWALVFGRLDGDPEGLVLTPVDDRWAQSVDAPVVVAGRMWNPSSDDEIVVAERAAATYHLHVGDTAPFIPYTPEETNSDTQSVPTAHQVLHGPHLVVRIVGIVRTPAEPLFVDDGLMIASPGLIRQHPDIAFLENAMVQLVHPLTDEARLEADVNTDVAPGAPVLDLHQTSRRVTASTDVERAALALLALAIALVGFVLVGQVVVRSASTIGADARILGAVGMRRRALAGAAALTHVPTAVIAGATAVVTAMIAAHWLPLGQAALVDPDLGLRVDWWITVPGAIGLAVLVLATCFATGWAVSGHQRLDPDGNPRGVAEWVRRRATPAVGIGTSFALRRSRGSRQLPVRAALAGAVIGVLGVTSALTLDHGLRDALSHPEQAGVSWDAEATPGELDFTDRGFSPKFIAAMRGVDQAVDEAQVDRAGIPVGASGTGVPAYAIRPLDRHPTRIQLVTLDGRGPVSPGEAAIGPATARALHLHVGDSVRVGVNRIRVRLVGTALFPTDPHAEFDQGLWLTPRDFDAVGLADDSNDHLVAVRFAPGATHQGMAALSSAAARFDGQAETPPLPPEITNLRGVRQLPRLLAGFLALLALAALLHTLLTTTRVRAGDFAVLRAIGFTRRSARLVLEVQAIVVFAVGLLFGLPLGIALGRIGWSEIARRVPLQEVSPITLLAVAIVIPTTLVVARALAVGPGRRITRLRTAEVLRSE